VRSSAFRTHQLFVGECKAHVRPQITATAAKADMGMRSTAESLRSNADNY
jgi:hypothetical protein